MVEKNLDSEYHTSHIKIREQMHYDSRRGYA